MYTKSHLDLSIQNTKIYIRSDLKLSTQDISVYIGHLI